MTSKRFPSFSKTWQNRFAVMLILASVLSGLATYAALTETPPLGNDPKTVIWLLNIDFILLVLLVGLISLRIVELWSGRKRGLAGSHLHVRLVYTFSILAAAPAIIMTIFAAFFFHFGVQTWFSDRVSTAINESQAVAEAYLEEHKQVIRADTLAMSTDLSRQAPILLNNTNALEKIVKTQSFLRNFSEAIVFNKNGQIFARSGLTFSLEFETVSDYNLRRAEEGEVVISTGQNDDRVRALVKIDNFPNTYLYVGRLVDQQVLSRVTATRQASQDYDDLQTSYSDLQVSAILIFVVIGIILMLAGIWLGLILARQLVEPITVLIRTADRVRAGDLSARVPDQKTSLQEFEYLAAAFNRMTKQIQSQQGELIEANRQMDRRRRFTETILTGVSSGVIGVDSTGRINLANSSSGKLLASEERALVGHNITEIMPQIAELLSKAHRQPQKITQGELVSQKPGDMVRTYLVRIAIELIGEQDVGAIITFDDITALQSAQRKAAWSDVARRIAHEMKNPLTPIQLSAERLQRKYLSQIKDDPETFKQCTDTIIKNVSDIGHMVNEFSSFARMPEPIMQRDDLSQHISDALSIHKQAHPEIKFRFSGRKKGKYIADFDPAQLRQVLNNLLQNSIDAMEGKITNKKIDLILTPYGQDKVALILSDNGPGFPKDRPLQNLTEPYVTHKRKGTGLGLAIVKKVMEDHKGSLILGHQEWLNEIKGWHDMEGANVILLFPQITQDSIQEITLENNNEKKVANA